MLNPDLVKRAGVGGGGGGRGRDRELMDGGKQKSSTHTHSSLSSLSHSCFSLPPKARARNTDLNRR